MKLKNKNVLIISPEPWDHIFVSKHHYAIHLAQIGNKVFFLNPPGDFEKVESTDYTNVFSVHYKKFIKGLRYFPSFLQQYFLRQKFNRLEQLCKTNFDIVWSFDNSVFYNFEVFSSSVLTISHIVDLNQNFQTERAASTAHFCFCTTNYIKERLSKWNQNVHKIHHGYNLVSEVEHVTFQGKSNIKAIYSGNLSMPYIDWEVLHQIISNNPDVDFYFIGPNDKDFDTRVNAYHVWKKAAFNYSNVFTVGRIAANLIPSYLMAADVLLVSYQEMHFIDQANPHKIIEYLGSGKVIVSSFTEEYETKNHLIVMSKSNSELPTLFSTVVNNLSYYNSNDLSDQRKSFALENTYAKQIHKIEEILAKNV